MAAFPARGCPGGDDRVLSSSKGRASGVRRVPSTPGAAGYGGGAAEVLTEGGHGDSTAPLGAGYLGTALGQARLEPLVEREVVRRVVAAVEADVERLVEREVEHHIATDSGGWPGLRHCSRRRGQRRLPAYVTRLLVPSGHKAALPADLPRALRAVGLAELASPAGVEAGVESIVEAPIELRGAVSDREHRDVASGGVGDGQFAG